MVVDVVAGVAGEQAIAAIGGKLAGLWAGRGANRVFWSGGKDAMAAARNYAEITGGKTLEMTFSGKALDVLTTPKTYPLLKPFWEKASFNFAKGAEGSVDVFHSSSKGVRLDSIWSKVEYPQLKLNDIHIDFHLAP